MSAPTGHGALTSQDTHPPGAQHTMTDTLDHIIRIMGGDNSVAALSATYDGGRDPVRQPGETPGTIGSVLRASVDDHLAALQARLDYMVPQSFQTHPHWDAASAHIVTVCICGMEGQGPVVVDDVDPASRLARWAIEHSWTCPQVSKIVDVDIRDLDASDFGGPPGGECPIESAAAATIADTFTYFAAGHGIHLDLIDHGEYCDWATDLVSQSIRRRAADGQRWATMRDLVDTMIDIELPKTLPENTLVPHRAIELPVND